MPIYTAHAIDTVLRDGVIVGNACVAAALYPSDQEQIWNAVWQANLALNALRDEQIKAVRQEVTESNATEIAALQAQIDQLQGQPPAGSVTQRQFRLALLGLGVKASEIDAIIAKIPEATAQEAARIEWEWASVIDRNNPLVASMAQAMDKTDEDIDQLFAAARGL